jgi:hypothetical protein
MRADAQHGYDVNERPQGVSEGIPNDGIEFKVLAAEHAHFFCGRAQRKVVEMQEDKEENDETRE